MPSAAAGTPKSMRMAHGGGADLEEFVEVGAGDAQEAQALQQRHLRVLRLRQHAEVEIQLRQFAVEVQRRIAQRIAFGRRGDGGHGRTGGGHAIWLCEGGAREAARRLFARMHAFGAEMAGEQCCPGRLRFRSPSRAWCRFSTCLTIDRPRPVPPRFARAAGGHAVEAFGDARQVRGAGCRSRCRAPTARAAVAVAREADRDACRRPGCSAPRC